MDNKLTPCEVAAAMTAWHMAIQAKLNSDLPEVSLEELAWQYGQHTTTPGDLEAVSHWYDWNSIMEFIDDKE